MTEQEGHDLKYSTRPDKDKLDELAEVFEVEGETQEERRDNVRKDPDILRLDWERVKETITAMIREEVGEEVNIKPSNLGWNNTRGREVETEAGEVVNKITDINGEFTLYVSELEGEILILRTDHDSPTKSQANTFHVRPRHLQH
jgi:hypothetical protein